MTVADTICSCVCVFCSGATWNATKHELPGFYALGLDGELLVVIVFPLPNPTSPHTPPPPPSSSYPSPKVRSSSLAYAAIDNLISQNSGVAKYQAVSKAEM